MPTGDLFVDMRNVPFLSSVSFASSQGQIELDSNGQLKSIGLCPSVACLNRGTAVASEAGYDPYVAWGRWTNGTVNVRLLGLFTSTQRLEAHDGIHYLVGVPTESLPTAGSATYSLLGATLATGKGVDPLTVSGNVAVTFAPNLGTRIGLDLRLDRNNGAQTYQITSTGGLTNPSLSELRLISPNRFGGALAVTSNTSEIGCNATGACTATFTGGFFGPSAQRLGVSYAILRNQSVRIEGVATFKKN